MNDNKKEIRRIRLEDLDSSLQNILLNRISKDDPTWKRLQEIIDDLYKKTHTEKKNITITINQSDNQTIHVYVPKKIGGIDYTSTFTCLTGTAYEAEVIAENGYNPGTLNVSRSGVFTNNKNINATSATKSNATVTITQSDNQTIHVYTPKKEGGTDHTSTFTCPRGTTYEAEVIAENGYTAGALNVNENGIINSDMSINANPAISYAKITIVQSDNQTIHVYTPRKSGGTDHTSSFTCSVGTTYEVEVIAANNYIAGTPNTKGGTFNSNMIISATSATVATAKVTIVQSDNQTIHVYTPQKSGGTDHTSSFTCPIGTKYEAEVIADSGYNPGTLNVSGGGVINGDKTINATSATKPQIFVSKGNAPWYNNSDNDYQWLDKDKVIKTDESVSGQQATVTCKDVTDMSWMFNDCSKLISLDLSNFDTSNVKNMRYMLDDCSSLTSIDLSNFNTSNVNDMNNMFCNCSKLTELNISNFNTSKVTDMREMFYHCSNITSLDLSNFDTSKATDMGWMFMGCSGLAALNISNFNTSKVTDMTFMFENCSNLATIDLSSFNTSKVTNMHGMFWDCSKLASIDVTNFDTSNVTDMGGMFARCSSITSLDLSNFNTSKVTDMSFMFYNCSNLTTIKGIIDMKSCTNYGTIIHEIIGEDSRMFSDCRKLKGVKIKNPPAGFDGAGLSSSQYTIVS